MGGRLPPARHVNPGDWLLDPVERLPGLLGHLHARALGQLGHEGEAARGAEVEPGPLVILVQGGVLVLLRHVTNLHVFPSQFESIEVLHSFLGILCLHVSDESVSLGPVRLLVLHELDGLDAAEGFEDPLEHLVADVAVEVAHVELHGPLLRPDHGVRVVTHSVLLRLARLHNYRHTQQLLA